MQDKTLKVDDEYAAFGEGLGLLIADIKAGKSVGEMTGDLIPKLIAIVGGLSNLGADFKKVDNQVYILKCLGDVLEPAA